MAGGKTDAKRPSSTASFVHRILRWLNYLLLAASLASIVCMFALRLFPTAWGWGFLSFSFLSIISSLVGYLSARHAACYGFHMFLLITSTSIQGAVFLLFVTKPDTVLELLQSNRSEYDGRILLKLDAALLLGVFCVQLVVLALACMVHMCEPTNYYEDLEGKTIRRGRNLSRVQEETCMEARRLGEAAGPGKEESELGRLHKAMKEKNGQKEAEEESCDKVEI